jgi:hypothetical protein
MSDVLATMTISGKKLALVDYGRPVWFLEDYPDGLRVIPNWNHKVVDALALFASNSLAVDMCLDPSIARVVDLSDSQADVMADPWRMQVYGSDRIVAELNLHEGTLTEFEDELNKLRDVVVLVSSTTVS